MGQQIVSRRNVLGLALGLPLVACSSSTETAGGGAAGKSGAGGTGGVGGASAGSGGSVGGSAGANAGTGGIGAAGSGGIGGQDCQGPDACAVTEDNIEGPFYKAGAPMSPGAIANLRSGVTGDLLQVAGVVYAADCVTPLEGAVVDVWQADSGGVYDNTGFTLRARMRTEACGRYLFDTILPGNYDTRPRHIHYKVSHPDGISLTTQLYFEGEQFNDTDPYVRASLIKPLDRTAGGDGPPIWLCRFDIVLA
ncbi:MAG: hypothetical protein H6718_28295 [Polyangiaceae bacterium]|nr:hypothetical protein [Polyangiaceae bacterium]